MSGVPRHFEPRFYERAAQLHVARQHGGEVYTNLVWGLDRNPATRREIDAAVIHSGRLVPVEIKSYPLGESECAEIVARYADLGFRRMILVAPAVEAAAGRWCAASHRPRVELIVFEPNLAVLTEWYTTVWPTSVPDWVAGSLASGLHHIRVILTLRGNRGQFVIGQQRTRVYDTRSIARLVARLPSPPARLLWTPQRFTIPRDLIVRRTTVTALGGFVPVDIDGDRLHRPHHACVITATAPVCQHCLQHARRELSRLVEALPNWAPVAVVTSGGRGVHAYFVEDPGVRRAILAAAEQRRIRIDASVTSSVRTTIALPGSLHAGTGQVVATMG